MVGSEPQDTRKPYRASVARICIAFTLIGMEPPSAPNGSARRPIGGSVALGDRLPSGGHFEWLASCVSPQEADGCGQACWRDPSWLLLPCQPGRTHLSASPRLGPASFIHVDSGTGKSGTVVTWLSLLSRTDTRKSVELRGFEPLTSCMPYKALPYRNVAGCGSTSNVNRWTSPGVAWYRCSLAPRLAPRPVSGRSTSTTGWRPDNRIELSNILGSLPGSMKGRASVRQPSPALGCRSGMSKDRCAETRFRPWPRYPYLRAPTPSSLASSTACHMTGPPPGRRHPEAPAQSSGSAAPDCHFTLAGYTNRRVVAQLCDNASTADDRS